jgi:hypothetical protein
VILLTVSRKQLRPTTGHFSQVGRQRILSSWVGARVLPKLRHGPCTKVRFPFPKLPVHYALTGLDSRDNSNESLPRSQDYRGGSLGQDLAPELLTWLLTTARRAV